MRNIKSVKRTKLPEYILYSIIALCILPTLLYLLGLNFSLTGNPSGSADGIDQQLHLKGAFFHAFLEWTAICAAFFTVVLALMRFRLSKDVTTLIIAISLFCAGIMDIYHIVATTSTVSHPEVSTDFVPLSWALGRTLMTLSLMVGVFILLNNTQKRKRFQKNVKRLRYVAVSLLSLSFLSILYFSFSDHLPQAHFPDSVIKRPYDFIPLILLIFGAVYLFPRFYNREKSIFSHSLILTVIPLIIGQIHLIFGSSVIYDHHFIVGHFLKVVSYIVPFLGIVYDYIQTYEEEKVLVSRLQLIQESLEEKATSLVNTNRELEKLSYMATHDLKAPISNIEGYFNFLKDDLVHLKNDDINESLEWMENSILQAKAVINDLTQITKITQSGGIDKYEDVDVRRILKNIKDSFSQQIREKEASIKSELEDCPEVFFSALHLRSIFSNLISNSIKYSHPDRKPEVMIRSWKTEKFNVIQVTDNGLGIDLDKNGDKIFGMFKRFHDHVEGSGMGLYLIKKIMEQSLGKVEIESELNKGTSITLFIPKYKKKQLDEDEKIGLRSVGR